MELGPKRPSLLWYWGPNSIVVVYMDPLGYLVQEPDPISMLPAISCTSICVVRNLGCRLRFSGIRYGFCRNWRKTGLVLWV